MRFTRFIPTILLALLFLAADPAFATILFAGGEDVDFALAGGAVVSTSAGSFRSSYARESLELSSGGPADPPPQFIRSPTFTAQTSVWFHFVWLYQQNNTGLNQQLMGIYGSDGVRRLLIRGTGGNQTFKLSTRNAAGTITDLVTCTPGFPPNNLLTKMDVYVNYLATSSGQFSVYANGVQFCNYTGNIVTDSATAVNQFDLDTAYTSATSWFSEVIVSTTPTQDMNLFTCAPQANGVNQNWTGNASDVNPTTINDTNSITTATSNTVAEFTCPSLVSGTYTVPAVIQNARIQAGSSGPQNYRFIARPATAGADYDNGSDIAGQVVFTNYGTSNSTGPQIWGNNPATSSPWSTTDLGTGVNFGVKSRP